MCNFDGTDYPCRSGCTYCENTEYYCPICGQELAADEDVYVFQNDVIGCKNCVKEINVCEVMKQCTQGLN